MIFNSGSRTEPRETPYFSGVFLEVALPVLIPWLLSVIYDVNHCAQRIFCQTRSTTNGTNQ